MSRQSLISIYETAISSRPQTRELLNEITLSNSMIEAFDKKYSPWFPISSTNFNDKEWNWTWPPNPPGYGGRNEVPGYAKLVEKQQYPNPSYIRTHITGIRDTQESPVATMMYSIPNVLLQKSTTWSQAYAILFEDLYETAIKMNMQALNITDPDEALKLPDEPPGGYGVRNKIFTSMILLPAKALAEMDKHSKAGSMWVLETKAAGANGKLLARYKVSGAALNLIIVFFAKVQNIMPQKDILQYPNVMALLEALLAAKSKRSKKSTSTAEVKETVPGLVDETDHVLVVQPPSWEFSRRYFGAPARRSLLKKGKILSGASWCTAASDYKHFVDYVYKQKNNLYYFVAKTSEEKLGAIRTLGSDLGTKMTADEFLKLDNQNKIHLFSRLFFRSLYTEGFAMNEQNMRRIGADEPAMDVLRSIYKIATQEGTAGGIDKLILNIKKLKQEKFQSYCNLFTLELRDQENRYVPTYEDFLKHFNLSWEWIQTHIKFCNLFD